MATVWIPSLLRHFSQGRETVQVSGSSIGQIIDNLDGLCPGIRERLLDGAKFRPGIAVAIDSQLAQGGLGQPVLEGSEVHFVPAISGGA